MKRAYYSNTISAFIKDDNSKILGELSLHHTHALEELQRNAWIGQIEILKDQLQDFSNGQVYFENWNNILLCATISKQIWKRN